MNGMVAKFCEKCGVKLLPNASFCEACGTKVVREASGIQAPPPSNINTSALVNSKNTPEYRNTPQRPSTSPRQPQNIPRQPQNSKVNVAFLIVSIIIVLLLILVPILWLIKSWVGNILNDGAKNKVSASTSQTKEIAQNQDDITQSQDDITQDVQNINSGQKPLNPPVKYSTTSVPTSDDFLWFTQKAGDFVFGIVPLDVNMLETSLSVSGSWKGLQMIYDYDGSVLGYGYFTMTLADSGSNVSAVINWHRMDWVDGGKEDLSGRSKETMTGNFFQRLQLGKGGNKIDLLFYERNGKQYGEGVWTVQSGEKVYVALVRP